MFIELIQDKTGEYEAINIDSIKTFSPVLLPKKEREEGEVKILIAFKDGTKEVYIGDYSEMLKIFTANNLILFASEEDETPYW